MTLCRKMDDMVGLISMHQCVDCASIDYVRQLQLEPVASGHAFQRGPISRIGKLVDDDNVVSLMDQQSCQC